MLQKLSLVVMMAVLSCGCREAVQKKIWTEETVPVKVEFRIVKDGAGDDPTLGDLEDPAKKTSITNSDIETVYVAQDELGLSYVGLTMTEDGAKKMMILSTDNIGKRLAIVTNGKLLTAPTIQGAVSTSMRITGSKLKDEEVKALAAGIMKYKALNAAE